MDQQRDDGQDAAWAHQLMLERERANIDALNRCIAAGAKRSDIERLAHECGIDVKHVDLGAARLG